MPRKTIVVYVCANTTCGKEGQDKSEFALDVPLQHGDAKKKDDLCNDCKVEHDEYMARYFSKADESETPGDEYDPTQDRAFSKHTAEQARHHRAAKLWAVGPRSTMKGNERPKGLTGPAGPKVLDAYEAYLKKLKDEAVNGVAAAVNGDGKAAI